MSDNSSNFLSRSSVNTPSSFTKSPYKYQPSESYNNNQTTQPKIPSSSWKEWKPNS